MRSSRSSANTAITSAAPWPSRPDTPSNAPAGWVPVDNGSFNCRCTLRGEEVDPLDARLSGLLRVLRLDVSLRPAALGHACAAATHARSDRRGKPGTLPPRGTGRRAARTAPLLGQD